jgi:RNA polymerase sigma-70 factor, ECF subfamily
MPDPAPTPATGPDAARSSAAADLEKHRPQLLRFALLQLRDRTAAEDAVQETLLAALQPGARFDGRSSVRTWLIGILKHKIADHLRIQARERPLESAEEERAAEAVEAMFRDDGHYAERPSDWQDPDQALQQRRFFDALERCLQALPANTARAFMMREVLGMETGEICKELSISSTNCWVLLHRARLALRACLDNSWFSTPRI